MGLTRLLDLGKIEFGIVDSDDKFLAYLEKVCEMQEDKEMKYLSAEFTPYFLMSSKNINSMIVDVLGKTPYKSKPLLADTFLSYLTLDTDLEIYEMHSISSDQSKFIITRK